MKKRYAFIAAAFAALLFTTMTPSSAFADPSAGELQDKLDDKAKDLEKITEDYNGAKEDLDDTNDKIADIKKNLPEMKKKADDSRKIVGNIAVSEYTRGSGTDTASNIMAGSPDGALDRLSVLGSINASQAADVDAYNKSASDLKGDKSELQDLKDDQKDTKSDIKDKKDKIESEIGDLKQQQSELGGQDGGYSGDLPKPSGSASAAVQFVYDQIDEPYEYSAAGPDSWDCSGLTMGAWNQAGVSLSHQTNSQYSETARVGRSELAPGDLVFYNGMNHVALYVGDGKIVHAPQEGQNVQAASIDSMAIEGYGRPN